MKTETITVPGIHCEHCSSAIEGALNPLRGVELASVDVAAKTVSVTYDEATVSQRELIDAIEAEGYEVPA